jgi:hypothetical protein
MAREKVPVISISLVGPANRTLEGVLRTLIARGHVIVARSATTARRHRPCIRRHIRRDRRHWGGSAQAGTAEAVRGPQVVFAAPGADMAVATSG